MSVATVITLGYGTFGTPGLVLTLGYGQTGSSAETSSGGYEERHYRDPYRFTRAPSAADIRRSREEWGILEKPAAVIAAVAQRQAEGPSQDEQQRLEELERELEAQGIEWESRYLVFLNALRERHINAEISRLIRTQLEADNSERLLLLLAALA